MEAFQLRMWDGRLGRWLSPDPYGQYASPYLGMGNNPISMIDADGGWAYPPSEGTFKNGYVHTDSDGSWTFQDNKWLDNTGDGWDFDHGTVFLNDVNVGFNMQTNNSFSWVDGNSRLQLPAEYMPKSFNTNGWPLDKMEILPTAAGYKGGTWGFTRFKGKKFHDGIDLKANVGDPVYSVYGGIVTKVVNTQIEGIDHKKNTGDTNGAGNRVSILSKGGIVVSYWHLSSTHLKVHQSVIKGQPIGFTGSTGNANRPESSGPHLHLNMTSNGKSVNPMNYIKF